MIAYICYMISKFIFTKILGWKLVGNFSSEVKKYIVIGAPHTSWKDFHIGILARSVSGVKVNFIGKQSLFKPPFGFIFKSLGGVPIDRKNSNNKVDAMIDVFKNHEECRLALSPEGTRKKVAKWKTGFYYIAQGANIPIVMFGFDFGNKEVKISEPYYLTNDIEKDFNVFYAFYKDIKGANPALFNNENFL